MEVIMTQFSPNEKVIWERTKNGVYMRSEHVIELVCTRTRKQSDWSFWLKSKSFMEGLSYGIKALFVKDETERKKLTQLKEKAFLNVDLPKEESQTITKIYYFLVGQNDPVDEHELKAIPSTTN
jgi:hypothetical protein